MKRRKARWNLLGWLVLLPAASGIGQTAPPTGQAGNQASDTGEPTYQISERTVRQNQNATGFSLGILGLYDSNYLGTASLQQGQAIIGFAPRIYTNVRRRNSLLSLDYQVMYRRYPGGGTTDAADHAAGLDYELQSWRRIRIKLSDNARYGPNDIRSSTAAAGADSGQQVFFNQQNMLANSLLGAVSITSGRKSRLELSGSHNLMRFDARHEEDTNTARVRANHEYQWSRRWFLAAEISNDWIRSANSARSGSILRFLGGPTLQLGEGWTIGGQAGGDRIHLASGDSVHPSFEASVAKVSATTRVGLQYWRRSNYTIGLSGLNRGDTVVARLDHRFRPRLSINMQAQYYRTFGIENVGRVKAILGGAGFEYAIIPSVLASMSVNYLYQKQQSPAASADDLKLDMYMISIGLYYFYPATKR